MNADAVVVLGGRENRVPVGTALARTGIAPVLLLFNANGEAASAEVPAEVEVLAFRPEPYTTRGEAAVTARLARERAWRSLVVVTSSYHVPRARRIFQRAFDGELTMVPAPATPWRLPFDLASEGVKWVALVRRG